MNQHIRDTLWTHYAIRVRLITMLRPGLSALAYRVDTPDGALFVKVYDKQRVGVCEILQKTELCMSALMWLSDQADLHGSLNAPLHSSQGQFKCEDERYVYVIFPFLNGDMVGWAALDAPQMEELAHILARLHQNSLDLPMDLTAITEDYQLPLCAELTAMLNGQVMLIPKECRRILTQHGAAIARGVERLQQLATQVTLLDLPFVLCHTDAHGYNVMRAGGLVLIDWESIRLASAEADLFMFWTHAFWGDYWEVFIRAYRQVRPLFAPNTDALAFYRLRRQLDDINEFLRQLVFDAPDDPVKAEALFFLERECAGLQ